MLRSLLRLRRLSQLAEDSGCGCVADEPSTSLRLFVVALRQRMVRRALDPGLFSPKSFVSSDKGRDV
jgi:hypothetical protein